MTLSIQTLRGNELKYTNEVTRHNSHECIKIKLTAGEMGQTALWSPAGKGVTSWLSFVASNCELSLSHWYPGSGLVLDCIDS